MDPKTVESEARNEIDQVKLPDVSAVLESDELTQAEQDRVSGAGGYGIEDDGSGT